MPNPCRTLPTEPPMPKAPLPEQALVRADSNLGQFFGLSTELCPAA